MFRIIIVISLFFSTNCFSGEFAKEANENPFLNGELNPKYEGEITALGGTVIDHIVVENNNLYKLDLKIKGIKPIWVTSFIKPKGKQIIQKGDRVVFKGYISKSISLDPSGELSSDIKANSLLMAIYVQNQGA
ncbi:hypothetical protein ISG33_09280 [Glaciecola sp. MH2013]|uniref:hypothetical protein n=1 Tax=Glaciecola sp. MH2013 TaxID=2785524 RepID=UPI0018A0B85B|nr:hypothetical protein [Glaciecola sp. MH2013]MBF7073584.1 hypothetical protein [Glaciecola sp. MH2013]